MSVTVWKDRRLVQHQLLPFCDNESVLALACVNRMLHSLACLPATWSCRTVELLVGPESAHYRCVVCLSRSPMRHAQIVIQMEDEAPPEGEEMLRLAQAPLEEQQQHWPTVKQIVSTLLDTPNVTAWDASRSSASFVGILDWDSMLSHPTFRRCRVLMLQLYEESPVQNLRHLLPPSLEVLSLAYYPEAHDEEAIFEQQPLSSLVTAAAALAHLHTLEIAVMSHPLTPAHWQLFATALPQLRRFGVSLASGSLSMRNLANHMRDAHFGASLEVLEVVGMYEAPRPWNGGHTEDAPLSLPKLRVLSLVSVLALEWARVSPLVLGCPHLQLISTSPQVGPWTVAHVDESLEGMLRFAQEALADRRRAAGVAHVVDSLNFQLVSVPRNCQHERPRRALEPELLSRIVELQHHIPVELRDRVHVTAVRPSELHWSRW